FSQERHQLNPEVTERIATSLLNNEDLSFISVKPTLLIDLSLMCQLEALPSSALRLLCFTINKGWVRSGKIQPCEFAIQDVTRLIERLGLHEEFICIAINAWQERLRSSINTEQVQSSRIGFSVDGEWKALDVSLRMISLDLSLFRSNSGRRVLSSLVNETESQSVQLIPFTKTEG